MYWLLVSALMMGPMKLPNPPPSVENNAARFLKKDIWQIYSMRRQCIDIVTDTTICAHTNVYPDQKVFIVFKWKFR